MPVECVQDVALSQVPNLNCGIVGGGEQVPAVGVEGHRVYGVLVRIVVLKKSLAADIPDLDGSVAATAGNAGTIRVELHRVNNVLVIIEALNEGSLGHVPELAGAII